MNIRETFLKLTSKTYPYGMEHLLERYLPQGIRRDVYGNYFMEVGEGSRVVFTSHLDTVCSVYEDVNHVYREENIVGTDGTTTLGADDKAGVVTMLYMIEKQVPGLYYFFIGEEVGCVGSSQASADFLKFNEENYDKVISFDRYGNTSVITHQSSLRCCSKEFASELCQSFVDLGIYMEEDDGGTCTDSLEFISIIPECTNISVGYKGQHTFNETQDLDFLERLCKACVEIDWEELPTERDPSVTEYKTYNYESYHDDEYGDWAAPQTRSVLNRSYAYSSPFKEIDDEFGEIRRVYYDGFSDDGDDVDDGEFFFKPLQELYLDERLSDDDIDYIIENILDENDEEDKAFISDLESMKSLKSF